MSTELSTKIESRIDKTVSASTGLTRTGAMAFSSVEQIMEFAKVMAIAGVAVPKHLRENVGACLAVAIQASEWQMSPFAVASKSYVVNDRLAFEAQLVNAVILMRAPIKGRFKISYSGEAKSRRCTVAAVLTDGETVEYRSPELGTIPTQNSPLWKGDPDQQLFYYSSRAMCRRHFPDVILGVYTPEELGESIDVESTVSRPIFTDPPAKSAAPEKPAAKPEPTPSEEPTAAQETPVAGPLEVVRALLRESHVTESTLMTYLVAAGLAKKTQALADLSEKKLVDIAASFASFAGELEKTVVQ